jgi:geminin
LTQTPEAKRKTPTQNTATTSSQTSPSLEGTSKQVTTEDLTSEKVSETYWQVLAEKRRAALEESLVENQELYERIATLEDELNQSKTLLTETRSLVEVLTEMLEEKESEMNTTMTPDEAPPQIDDNKDDEDISD